MTDSTPNSDSVTVQERIQTLTDVHNRLQTLRYLPTLLLRPPSASRLADFSPSFDATIDRELGVTFSSTPTHDFGVLREFVEVLCSDKVQEALRAARTSEETDQSELGVFAQRKRKRPRSPVGSPQPYVPSPPRSSSLFASPEDEPAPLRAESLVEFLREFNRSHAEEAKSRLVIWTRTQATRDALNKGAPLTSPVVLRFLIPDVLMAYISLVFESAESPLVVESVAAFGPRERRLPHEQSEFSVFQGLSQHLAKMLESHPRVPVQVLMASLVSLGVSSLTVTDQNVLVSYRGLFVERCARCERVLAEGHVPPVGRVFVVGCFEARHNVCAMEN